MDIDVATALNCLTAREKAVLVAFLQLSREESGKIVARSHLPGLIERECPQEGVSPESN